jgi:hypothetical protein
LQQHRLVATLWAFVAGTHVKHLECMDRCWPRTHWRP